MLNDNEFLVCGSGASEGVPAPFCSCRVCRRAREQGGRERRTKTSFQWGDSVRFDFSSDAPRQAEQYGLDYSRLRHLFFSHSHSDHCHLEDFWTRGLDVDGSLPETLHCYGNAAVLELFERTLEHRLAEHRIQLHLLTPGQPVKLPEREGRITPLRADHIPTEEALLFLLETRSRRILIANDTQTFPEATLDFLQGRQLTGLFIDCTWGALDRELGHLGLPNVLRLRQRLQALGALAPDAQTFLTHISHFGQLGHVELEACCHDVRMRVAYDGLRL